MKGIKQKSVVSNYKSKDNAIVFVNENEHEQKSE